MGDATAAGLVIELDRVSKDYGAVRALRDVSLGIGRGRMLSVMGHNGAGKSTLIRILAGLVAPSSGTVRIPGAPVPARGLDPNAARALGIRCVFQELSLCPSLTVAENVRIVHPRLRGRGWRARCRTLIREQLDRIFPGHDIDPDADVARLTIGRRQMVEIARAFTVTDVPLRLVILDEATSSLDASAAEQLMQYTRRVRADGVSCLFISHRLREVLDHTDDIAVMRDGALVEVLECGPGVSEAVLVERMGSVAPAEAADVASGTTIRTEQPVTISIEAGAGAIALTARRGEIVGLAGLAGEGQREKLLDVLAAARGHAPHGVHVTGRAAYVTGDRQGEGVFPLWSVADNLSIASLGRVARGGWIDLARERKLVERWCGDLAVRTPRIEHPIRALSGGNQQKVLLARALAEEPEILLLDDPMRGVDVNTKAELYRLIRQMAANGCTVLWYTTETAELTNCERVYVLRAGRVADEIARTEFSEERVIGASFERG